VDGRYPAPVHPTRPFVPTSPPFVVIPTPARSLFLWGGRSLPSSRPTHPTELNPFSQQVNNTHLAALDCLKLVVVAIASPVDERLTTLGRGVVVERRDCAAAPADLGGLVAERVARGRNKRGIGPSSGDTELRARRVACLLGLKRVVVCDTPAVNELLARLARFVVEPGRERGTTKSLSRYRKRRGSGEGTVQSARPTPPRRSAKSPATMSGSRENVQIRTGSAGSEQKLELVGSGGNPGMGRSVGRSVGRSAVRERRKRKLTNKTPTCVELGRRPLVQRCHAHHPVIETVVTGHARGRGDVPVAVAPGERAKRTVARVSERQVRASSQIVQIHPTDPMEQQSQVPTCRRPCLRTRSSSRNPSKARHSSW